MGRIADLAMGFPGYDARIPKANGFLPEMLVPRGYAAYHVGKWHLTPEDEYHMGATRERWPLGRGFERSYGFHGGETHQFAPTLFHDNHWVAHPVRDDGTYHLTEDMVDHAALYLRDLRSVDPEKRFFLYFATGACHSPHHAPPEWLERERGRFDAGWDAWRDATFERQVARGLLPAGTELSPRPDWVPAWDELPDDAKRVYARYMEAFAAFLAHTDHQIGRLLQVLEETGDLDDTLIIACSDNGASSEGGPVGSVNDVRAWNVAERTVAEALERIDDIGGPRMHNNYPWGWTVAGNTPFRRWKRETHEGGVADPLVVSWRRGIAARGELRRQYVHAIDVVPTVLELAGIEAPEVLRGIPQRPVEGVSFAYALDAADAPSRHETQYYEMFGCRALYDRGWKAVTYHPIQADEPGLENVPWELYDVEVDASECHDLAESEPERLREMVDRWWVEAERHGVLPIDNRPFSELVFGRPLDPPERQRYVYYPYGSPVPEESAVNVRNRSHLVTAHVEIPEGGAQGVLVAQGSLLGGWTLFVEGDRLHYVHNYVGLRLHRVDGEEPVEPGEHVLAFRFTKTEEMRGTGALLVDGRVVGEGEIPRFTPIRFSLTGAGLSCGYDAGLEVVDDYRAPFRFTGTLRRVVVDVEGSPYLDPEGEAEVAIATQ
jgi:arylsulfatase